VRTREAGLKERIEALAFASSQPQTGERRRKREGATVRHRHASDWSATAHPVGYPVPMT